MFFRIIICVCLVFIIAAASSKRTKIIGGEDALISEFPHLASLRRISNNDHVCGGAILNEYYILTAAHCFGEKYMTLTDMIIYIGKSYLCHCEAGTTFSAERIFSHPGFMGIVGGVSYSHDIAVVKVQGKIEFNDKVKPIELPTKDIHHGDVGILAGWGLITYPSTKDPNQLQKVRMPILDYVRCRRLLTFDAHKDQFCAFRKAGIGACIGDSGSPFILGNKVIGVASVCIPCAKGIPDVYTNVFSHMDFITTVLARSPDT